MNIHVEKNDEGTITLRIESPYGDSMTTYLEDYEARNLATNLTLLANEVEEAALASKDTP